MNEMKLTSLLPWFGSKRTLAPVIVDLLGPHAYYFEACAGSMSVLFAKEPAHHETVCDLHGALTNLAWVVQKEETGFELFNALQRVSYSDNLYKASKEWLTAFEDSDEPSRLGELFAWAYHYFLASWMGRNGVSGTARVNYQIATRWTKGGGSGPLRFRNAVDSIPAWFDRLRNVHVLRRDVFDVLPKIEDDDGVAIYADPPYLPDTMTGNGRYIHDFTAAQHAQLANELRRFKKAVVVVSYYDSPRLDQLYPGWVKLDASRQKHLACQNARGQKRTAAPEVILCNAQVNTSRWNQEAVVEPAGLFE